MKKYLLALVGGVCALFFASLAQAATYSNLSITTTTTETAGDDRGYFTFIPNKVDSTIPSHVFIKSIAIMKRGPENLPSEYDAYNNWGDTTDWGEYIVTLTLLDGNGTELAKLTNYSPTASDDVTITYSDKTVVSKWQIFTFSNPVCLDTSKTYALALDKARATLAVNDVSVETAGVSAKKSSTEADERVPLIQLETYDSLTVEANQTVIVNNFDHDFGGAVTINEGGKLVLNASADGNAKISKDGSLSGLGTLEINSGKVAIQDSLGDIRNITVKTGATLSVRGQNGNAQNCTYRVEKDAVLETYSWGVYVLFGKTNTKIINDGTVRIHTNNTVGENKLPPMEGSGDLELHTDAQICGAITVTGQVLVERGKTLLATSDDFAEQTPSIKGADIVLKGNINITAGSVTVVADKKLSGSGTVTGGLTFENGAIIDASAGCITVTGTVTYPAEMTVKGGTEGTCVLKTTSAPTATAFTVEGDDTLTVQYVNDGLYLKKAVATVGTTKYASLSEAMGAAAADATVTLVDNLTLDTTVAVSKNLTLDLNGKTLTCTASESRPIRITTDDVSLTIDGTDADSTVLAPNGLVQINADNVNFTVKGGYYFGGTDVTATPTCLKAIFKQDAGANGQITLTDVTVKTGSYIFDCAKNGDVILNVKGGTYTSVADATDSYLFGTQAKSQLTFEKVTVTSKNSVGVYVAKGTATLKDCQFTMQETGAHGIINTASGATVTINGGSYTAPFYGVQISNSGATVTINDAKIKGTTAALAIGSSEGVTSTVTIKGGSFTGGIKATSNKGTNAITVNGGSFDEASWDKMADNMKVNYLADGKAAVLKDGWYQVVDAVCEIQRATYVERFATLPEALAAAQAGTDKTVTVLSDKVDWGTSFVLPEDVTIKLGANATELTAPMGYVWEDGALAKATNWLQVTDTTWFTGNANEYTLTRPEQLAGLAKLVNEGETFADVKIILGNDIDLAAYTWPGIGLYNDSAVGNAAFQGNFNGDKYTITGVTFTDTGSNKYRGFFNQIYKAIIQNVTVNCTGFEEGTTGSYGGAVLVGHAWSSTLASCVTEGALNVTHNAAGLVVRISSDKGVGCVIRNCTNKANLESDYTKMGGIAAFTQTNYATPVIENCVNEGAINTTTTSYNDGNGDRNLDKHGGVGGIIGWVGYGGSDPSITIKNCSNTGVITITDKTTPVGQIAGSIWTNYTIDGTNTGLATTLAADHSAVNGLCFATVADDGVATYTQTLTAGNTYLVTAQGAKPVVALAAGESIAFDTTLASIDASGITTVAEGETLATVTDGNTTTYLIPVAMIGDVPYASLSAAFQAAADASEAQTVTLTKSLHLTEVLTIAAGTTATLDLAGQKITVAKNGNSLYAFENSGTLTLTDSVDGGSITARGVKNFGTMVMNGGTIYTCDTNGGFGVWNYGDFTMDGGAIKTTHWVGHYESPATPTCFNNQGADSKATFNGGTIESTNVAVYAVKSSGTLTFSADSTASVYAPRGVAVDAGTATFAGGSFTTFNARFSGDKTNGSNGHVAAEVYYPLYVDKADAAVTISGGTFTVVEDENDPMPIAAVQIGSNPDEDIVSSTVTITGGTFTAPLSLKGTTTGNGGFAVSGGTFAADPSDYVVENYVAVEQADATFKVEEFTNWIQVADTSWYSADDADSIFEIDTAAELAGLAKLVNGGNAFAGKTVVLTANIDLLATYTKGEETVTILWTPIGTSGNPFKGHFDGQNNTISNLKVYQTENCAGLFGSLQTPEWEKGSLSNVKLHNVNVYGKNNTAALVGCPYTTDVTNCHVSGSIAVDGYGYVGGIGGQSYGDVINCSVIGDADTTNTINCRYWSVGGIVGQLYGGIVCKAEVKNVTISGNYYATAGIAGLVQNDGNAVCIVLDDVQVSDTVIRNNGSNGAGSIAGLGGNTQPIYIVNYSTSNVSVSNNDVATDAVLGESDLTNYAVGTAADAEGHIPTVLTEDIYTTKVTAGTFVTIADVHLAEGFDKVTLDNGTYMVFAPVAKVGDTPYATLADALAAAESGEEKTVTVLSNTVAWGGSFAIPEGVTIVLGAGVTASAPTGYVWNEDKQLVVFEPNGSIGAAIVNFHKPEIAGGAWVTLYCDAIMCGQKSMKIELYSGETLVGTTELVDKADGQTTLLHGGEQGITYHFFLEGSDDWWKTTWNEPRLANVVPDKVVLIVDDKTVAENTVSLCNTNDNMAGGEVYYNWGDLPGVKVAQVGETYFETLQAAIDATDPSADPTQTVVLLGNTKFAAKDANPATQAWVKEDDAVVIDLGGYTVDGAFYVNGTATIQNGVITNGTMVSGIETEGNLTMKDLTVVSNRHGVRVSGGTTTIESGTYQTLGTSGTRHAVNASGNTTVLNIQGGTFLGAGYANLGGSGNCVMDQGCQAVNIAGGTFLGSNAVEGPICAASGTSISGGLFEDAKVETWRYHAKTAEGYGAYKIADGMFVVSPICATVTGVDGEVTLEEAFAKVTAGGTITLTRDVALPNWSPISKGSVSFTLDGNGRTITGLPAPLFRNFGFGGVAVTIRDLTIADSTIRAVDYTDKGNGSGHGAAFVAYLAEAVTATFENCHVKNVTVTGSTYSGGFAGYISGSVNSAGSMKYRATFKNCSAENVTVTSETGSVGVFVGHTYAELGLFGCEMRGTNATTCRDENGTRPDKAGAVIGRINGGNVVLDVTDTSTTTVSPAGTVVNRVVGDWVGGTYTVDAGEYFVDPTQHQNKYNTGAGTVDGELGTKDVDGTTKYVVYKAALANVTKARAAEVAGVRYETLAEALAHATDGATITMLGNEFGCGIIVPEGKYATGLTIDFAGYTYTVVEDPLAGSNGTQTQAFQLLKDNTITLKNGTIRAEAEGVKMLVQNYANLTLENMNLSDEGANGMGAGRYVLSNNNGDTVIKDTTIEVTKEGGIAFDVYPNEDYGDVSVTVEGNSVIKGEIEVAGTVGENQSANLTLNGGDFTGATLAVQNPVVKVEAAEDVKTALTPPTGYYWNADGILTGHLAMIVADDATAYYPTLADAIAAAQPGQTVTLLADCTGTGIVVDAAKFTTAEAPLTVDFNGKTYTVVDPTVGSAGTQTNGFQLQKDNYITFKNGAINSETLSCKILVQNYSNLTLDNMVLTGAESNKYVLSNNYGNQTLTNGTTITATEGNVAFDVYYGMSDTYADGVKVTIATSDVVINGKIEYSKADGTTNDAFDANASLTVPEGYTGIAAPNGFYWNNTSLARITNWIQIADTSWYDATKTEFVITTAEQLAGLAKLVNEGTASFYGKTICLANNIDLGKYPWTPIGTSSAMFKGTFDGSDKTIKTLNVDMSTVSYVGLFGYVAYATVKNIVVENAKVTGASGAAGIVGAAGGTINLINCHLKGVNEMSAAYYAGAIAGLMYNTTGTIDGCTAEGTLTVTAEGFLGGLVGCIWSSSPMTLTNCSATGDITVTGTSSDYFSAAGLFGTAQNILVVPALTNCHLQGKFRITGGSYQAAGIITGAYVGKIDNCTVIGEDLDENGTQSYIKAATSQATGIIAWTGEGSNNVIQNCQVKNVAITAGTHSAASIAGIAQYGLTIQDCTVEDVNLSGGATKKTSGLIAGTHTRHKKYPTDYASVKLYNNTISDTTLVYPNLGGISSTEKIGLYNYATDPDDTAVFVGNDVTFDENGKVTSGSFEVFDETIAASAILAPEKAGVWNEETKTYDIDMAVAKVKSGTTTINYATFAEAIANAPDGATVTLFRNCSGAGIVVPEGAYEKGLTVDFAGYTYTVNKDPLAGSNGTKTQAFQLLKNNNITFKDGKIRANSANVKMLVQNYANLTLDNMDLSDEGSNGLDATRYVLSNNSGATVLKGGTTITSTKGGVAFDVCRYASYPSVSVTVADATINGTIEVSGAVADAQSATLTLTFAATLANATLKIANDSLGAVVTKDADAVMGAPAGFEWTAQEDGTEQLTKLDVSESFTVKPNIVEGGTVSKGELGNDGLLSITAQPNEGYVFVGWSGEGFTSLDANANVTITGDNKSGEVIANFIPEAVYDTMTNQVITVYKDTNELVSKQDIVDLSVQNPTIEVTQGEDGANVAKVGIKLMRATTLKGENGLPDWVEETGATAVELDEDSKSYKFNIPAEGTQRFFRFIPVNGLAPESEQQ